MEPATTAGIYCQACGYDLRGSLEGGDGRRCPECGRIFSPGDPTTFRPRPFAAPWKRALGRWAKRGAILLLVLGVLVGGLWGWFYWGWHEEQAALAEAGMGILPQQVIAGGAAGRWLHDAGVPGRFVLERTSIASAASDAELLALRKLHRLETLYLRGTVTDAGMARLRAFPHLRHLSIMDARITDAGLPPLRDLPLLERLSVNGAAIVGPGLVHLEQLKRLEHLSLWRMPLTDAGLVHLKPLKRVTVLHVSQTAVTDAGLAHLAALPALRTLGLGDTRVTDAGLAHLAGSSALRYIDLQGTKVTPAGVARLKAALPGCEIIWP